MIDLRMTREEMLVAIGAHDASGVQPADTAPCMPAVLTDPLAPAFCTAPHVRLAVRGHTRDDLFPVLKVVLAARFAAVPPARLTRDLLPPLKNGQGNAYKRGNARDRMEMVNRGEMSWVRDWTGKLSKELIYRRPWLCLYEALSRSWFGQLEEANLLLNEAEQRIRADVSAPRRSVAAGL